MNMMNPNGLNTSDIVVALNTANKNTSLLITAIQALVASQAGGTAAEEDMATALQAIQASQATIAAQSNRVHTGTFTMTATATRVVNDVNVLTTSQIFLQSTNLAAGTLQGSAKALSPTSKSTGVSFTVSTANATSAVGTEVFSYLIVNP